MEYFWNGGWQHIIFGKLSPDREGSCPIIRQLCFGPLETREYGVTSDNKFYYKEHIIEGIEAGKKTFEIIDLNAFSAATDREAALCARLAPHLAERLAHIRREAERRVNRSLS